MNQDPKPNFYAIIPAYVRYCKDLELGARLLYGEITALCQQEGYCWATNQYFASLYETEVRTIQRWIESLKKQKFIKVEVEKKGIQVRRLIWISHEIQKMFTTRQKCHDPMTKMTSPHDKNDTHNNTSITTHIKETPFNPPLPKELAPQTSADAETLFLLFMQKIRERRPTFKEPPKTKWLKDLDAMIRLDKRSVEEIKQAIEWVHTNEFWAANCLSPASLRKNFDQICMKMNAIKPQQNVEKEYIKANKEFMRNERYLYPGTFKQFPIEVRENGVFHDRSGTAILFSWEPYKFKDMWKKLISMMRC